MPIGWGIIGTGAHADRVMAFALSQINDTKLIAVCSRSLERATTFAAKHGISRSYDTLEKMWWYGIGNLSDLVAKGAQQFIVAWETLEKHSFIDTEPCLRVGRNVFKVSVSPQLT